MFKKNDVTLKKWINQREKTEHFLSVCMMFNYVIIILVSKTILIVKEKCIKK